MNIKVETLHIEKPTKDLYSILGYKHTIDLPTEINGTARLIHDPQLDFDKLTNNEEPLTLYADLKGDSYLLKNCRITGYDVTMTSGGPIESTFDFVAEDAVSPAYVKVKFRDVEVEVDYKHYSKLEGEDFESMTYSDFKDKVMVEEL